MPMALMTWLHVCAVIIVIGTGLLGWKYYRRLRQLLDVTDRQKTMLESEFHRFYGLLNALPDTLLEIDDQGSIYRFHGPVSGGINAAVIDFTGYNIYDIFPLRAADVMLQAARETSPDNNSVALYSLEIDEVTRWFEISVARNPDQVETGRFIVLSRDITEQKNAEIALSLSESKYRLTINALDVAVHVVDRDLNIQLCNDRFSTWLRELGFSGDIAGHTIRDICPFLPPQVDDEYARVFDSGEPLMTQETTEFDNFHIITETRKVPVFEDNAVKHVLTVIQDITERKRVEAALSESERQYRSLQENIPIGVFRVTPDGSIVSINPATAKIYGYESIEEMRTINITALYHDLAERDRLYALLNSQKYIKEEELRCRRKDGSIIWVQLSVQAITGDDGAILYADGVVTDVTASKHAELALQESTAKLHEMQNIVNHSHAIVFLWPIKGKPTEYVSDNISSLGYTPAEFYSGDISLKELIHPDDRERVLAEVQHYQKQSDCDSFHQEYRVVDKARTTIWMHDETLMRRDASGKITHFQGILVDITARKLAEEKLRETNQLLEKIADTSPALITLYDLAQNKNIYTSRSLLEAIGYSPEMVARIRRGDEPELAGSLINEDDWPKVHEFDERLRNLRDGEMCEGEYRMRDPQNEWQWIRRLTTVFNRDDNGAPAQVVNIYEIVTQRKQADQALRQSEEKTRMLFENVKIGIALVDYEGQFVFVNQTTANGLGVTMEEAREKTMWDLFPAEVADIQMQITRRVIDTNKEHHEERQLYVKSGWRWYDVLIRPFLHIYEGHEVLAMIIAYDINAQKMAEKALREAHDALKRAQRIIVAQEKYRQAQDIAGGFAHEIRNALFPAKTGLSKLRDSDALQGPENAWIHKMAIFSDAAVDRAIDLTRLISEYTSLEKPRKAVPLSLEKIINDAITTQQIRIEENDITILKHGNGDAIVESDYDQMMTVLSNLLVNALDALKGTDRPTISFTWMEADDRVQLAIADNGPGIPDEHRDRIFDVFYSTKPATGSGLGLSMVKRIVEMYGGSIVVQSAKTSGTVFTLRLLKHVHDSESAVSSPTGRGKMHE